MPPSDVITDAQKSRAETRELQRRYYGIAARRLGYATPGLPKFAEVPEPSLATEDLLRELVGDLLTGELCKALAHTERVQAARDAHRVVNLVEGLSGPWGSVDQSVGDRIREASRALPDADVRDHLIEQFILLCALADEFSEDLSQGIDPRPTA